MAPKKARKRTAAANIPETNGGTKKQKQQQQQPTTREDEVPADLNTSTSPSSDQDLQKLLEPYSKDQLISFLCDAAVADVSLLSKIKSVADRDVSHRKVFVHGLSWDTTREDLVEALSPFGSIEECNVVVDKVTGRTKGYGFVLFETREGAARALKQPQKKIKSRLASCQLASIGPVASGGSVFAGDNAAKKIYVSNVPADAAPDKLREFFAKFGEIEIGPLGYDTLTGKSRGFALFVYKTVEGLKKALEDPHKMFEGHQLHCQKATESKAKGMGLAGVTGPFHISIPGTAVSAGAGVLGPAAPQPVLAAVAAAQNLALISQNPAYGALLGQNPLMAAALSQAALNQVAFNPAATALNPATLNQMGGVGLGAYGGKASLLGTYGAQSTASLQGMAHGQSSLGGSTGSYGGMWPYI